MQILLALILILVPAFTSIGAFSPNLPTRLRPRSETFCLSASKSKRGGAMSRKNKKSGSSSKGGFGKIDDETDADADADADSDDETDEESKPTTTTMKSSPAGSIYSRPALYDLAFGYRNYEEEVKFLLASHDKYSTGENTGAVSGSMNIIELAAGPARHTITALRNYSPRLASCTAVDLSSDMVKYSNEIADMELGDAGSGGMRDRFEYMLGDMRTLSSDSNSKSLIKPGSMDAAWILLGSMQHLTKNDDVISCFSSTSELLREGGTLTIELPHPRETFTMVECTRNGWEVPLEDEDGEEYGELKIIWGDDDDKFDPIRQVRDFTVAMDLTISEDMKDQASANGDDLTSVKEIVPMRLFTYQEIEIMARVAGFEITDLYGALSDEVDVNSDDEAFRLVCILRKVRSPLEM